MIIKFVMKFLPTCLPSGLTVAAPDAFGRIPGVLIVRRYTHSSRFLRKFAYFCINAQNITAFVDTAQTADMPTMQMLPQRSVCSRYGRGTLVVRANHDHLATRVFCALALDVYSTHGLGVCNVHVSFPHKINRAFILRIKLKSSVHTHCMRNVT